MGTPLSGSGLNARAILYLTGALECSVGHFEAAAAVADNAAGVREPPLLMNASDSSARSSTRRTLFDASTPAPDLSKAAREALCRERHRTLPFRKVANAIASNSTKEE